MTTLRDKINDLVMKLAEEIKELGNEGAGDELVDEIMETIGDEFRNYLDKTLK